MDDIKILNEETKEHRIFKRDKEGKRTGKYRSIFLYMLSLSDYYEEFVPRFVVFLNFFKVDNEKIRLPTGKNWNQKKVMKIVGSQLRRVFSYALVRKEFIRLLKKVGYLKMGRRYFEKYATPSDLIEIFLYVYKHNVDDFKKKILEACEKVQEFQELQQTSTGQSSSGAGSGRFQDAAGFRITLPRRFPRLGK